MRFHCSSSNRNTPRSRSASACRVIHWNEKPVHAFLDEIRRAAHARRDQRAAARHRLEGGQAESFARAGAQPDVAAGVEARDLVLCRPVVKLDPAGQRHVLANPLVRECDRVQIGQPPAHALERRGRDVRALRGAPRVEHAGRRARLPAPRRGAVLPGVDAVRHEVHVLVAEALARQVGEPACDHDLRERQPPHRVERRVEPARRRLVALHEDCLGALARRERGDPGAGGEVSGDHDVRVRHVGVGHRPHALEHAVRHAGAVEPRRLRGGAARPAAPAQQGLEPAREVGRRRDRHHVHPMTAPLQTLRVNSAHARAAGNAGVRQHESDAHALGLEVGLELFVIRHGAGRIAKLRPGALPRFGGGRA